MRADFKVAGIPVRICEEIPRDEVQVVRPVRTRVEPTGARRYHIITEYEIQARFSVTGGKANHDQS